MYANFKTGDVNTNIVQIQDVQQPVRIGPNIGERHCMQCILQIWGRE